MNACDDDDDDGETLTTSHMYTELSSDVVVHTRPPVYNIAVTAEVLAVVGTATLSLVAFTKDLRLTLYCCTRKTNFNNELASQPSNKEALRRNSFVVP